MTSKNDITGDIIATKANTDAYRNGWDRIFSAKKETLNTSKNNPLQASLNDEKNLKPKPE